MSRIMKWPKFKTAKKAVAETHFGRDETPQKPDVNDGYLRGVQRGQEDILDRIDEGETVEEIRADLAQSHQ
jgi:hypothetical protein